MRPSLKVLACFSLSILVTITHQAAHSHSARKGVRIELKEMKTKPDVTSITHLEWRKSR